MTRKTYASIYVALLVIFSILFFVTGTPSGAPCLDTIGDLINAVKSNPVDSVVYYLISVLYALIATFIVNISEIIVLGGFDFFLDCVIDAVQNVFCFFKRITN